MPSPTVRLRSMSKYARRILAFTAAVSATALGIVAAAEDHAAGMTLFGGCGGAYFLGAPGSLDIDVVKRDRNRRETVSELRAILFGPDRTVLAEARIPDDRRPRGGGIGPAQSARLSAKLERPGICGLMVTVSGDRYGENVLWGLRCNRPYVIETARGHKDARHEEPLVLFNPDKPCSIGFQPRSRPFEFEVLNPNGRGSVELRDAAGNTLASFPLADGRSHGTIDASVRRSNAPWQLVVPPGESVVQIDGVTRWENSDPFPDMACWTPESRSWFPLLENHWLVSPYRRRVDHPPSSDGETTFRIYNNATRERAINLALEFSGSPWTAKLSTNHVVLAPKKHANVKIEFRSPPADATHRCHVRATPADSPDLSTFATLTVHSRQGSAQRAMEMPLVLRPFEHENEQFGYLPTYPLDAEMYFDLSNRPFTLDKGRLATLADGKWISTAVMARNGPGLDPETAFSPMGSKVAFDGANNLFLLGISGSRRALLRSADGGAHFIACDLPGGSHRASFDIESFSGQNMPAEPPPIVRYTLTETDPKLFWRRIHKVELLLAKDSTNGMAFGPPILVSTQGIGLAMHSGIPSTIASSADRTHICWGEATDPGAKAPGVPFFVATFDRSQNRLGPPALVGHGAPANDIHNTPSLTIDGAGILHAIGGTHGRPFPYATSLKKNDAGGGWTIPIPTGENLSQTYIGMVCGRDGTIHIAYRLWQTKKDPFPLASYATLAYQRKRPGQPWEPPTILIVPPLSEYSVFYHRLTIDRRDRLFLSYDYWSTFWFYRNDHPGRRRSLLMSPDGGSSWKLAEDQDMRL